MKRIAIPLLLSLSLLLSGCQNTDTGSNGGDSASTGAESVAVIDTAALFSDRDLDGSYDESAAVHIQLEGETAVCDSDAVSIDGSRITLLDEGTYLVSGALTDGQIVVDAGDTDKVQIVLASASLTCADSAAIYSKSADKVFLTLAEGTENTLTNGGSYTAIDKNNIDSVVFSKTDLTLNGSGSLTIDAQAGHGVVSKDELTINGGTFTVDSVDDCLHSGGALAVTGGTFTLSSGDDAIHSDDAVTIRAGEFSIPYCYEGVEGLSVTVEGAAFDVIAHDDGFNAAGGADSSGFGGRDEPFAASEDSFITVNGGTITVVSDGDCLDSNGDLTVNGGTLDLTCNGNGNTALDCSGSYTNNGGSVTTNDGSETNSGGRSGNRLEEEREPLPSGRPKA
jgi:predicted small secreted protein